MQIFGNFTTHGPNPHVGPHVAANSATHTVTGGESTQGYFDVVVAFDAPFDDTNYFATATIEFAAGNVHSIYVGYIVKATSGITVRVFCDTGGSWTGTVVTVNVAAFHAF